MITARTRGKTRDSLRRDARGALAVELAMLIPVLITLLVGGIELGRFVLLDQKLSRAAVTIADLVSQSEVLTQNDLDNFFAAADDVVAPFTLDDKGRVFVTSVSTTGANPPRIDWQQDGAGTLAAASQIGLPGGAATLPPEMEVRDGENLIVAEVFYDYDAAFVTDFVPNMIVYRRAFFRPRLSDLGVLGN